MPFNKDEHPRLYFSAEELKQLRRQSGKGIRGRILALMKARCERFLDPASPHHFDFRERRRPCWQGRGLRMVWEPAMHILAFTYAFTGETRYGRTAVDALLNAIETRLADGCHAAPGHEYDGWRRSMANQHDKGMHAWAVCNVYDLCFELMSDAEKKAVQDYIIESMRILDDPLLWRNDSNFISNNRGGRAYVGVKGMYPLAIEGDVDFPEIESYLCDANFAADTYMHSAFDQDGVCYEGGSYAGALNHIGAFARMLARSGRGGFLNDPLWEKFLHYQVYELLPTGGRLNNLNDCGDHSGSALPSLFLMGKPEGAIIPWLAHQIDLHPSRFAPGDGEDEGADSLFDMMFPAWLWEWREGLPSRSPAELGFPLSNCAPQRGIASMRTGWGKDDILLSHKCGREEHRQHRQSDQNHLALYALGESFLVDEGYGRAEARADDGGAPPARYFSAADVHNVIIVDGRETNPLGGITAGGRIIDWRHAPDFDTTLGDARGAHTLESAVETALRRVVFVRNAPCPFIIVIDKFVAGSPGDHAFECLWRTAETNRIEVNGADFIIAGKNHDCYGNALFPADAQLKVKNHYGRPQLRATTRANELLMVTAFAPVRRGEAPPKFMCRHDGRAYFTIAAECGGMRWTIRAGADTHGPLRKPGAVSVKMEA